MPKYDDFGRPIYETAEEYNQAHRGGVCPRTYDTAESYTNRTKQKNTTTKTQKPIKKSKILIVCIVICFVIMFAILGVVFMNTVSGGFYESTIEQDYREDEWEDEAYGEYLGDDTTALTEGFETFIYEGQTYTLPMTYQDVLKMGLALEDGYDADYMIETDYDELVFLMDEEGYSKALIGLSNHSGEDLPLKDCTVHYFYIENPVAYDIEGEVPDFVFGNGLTFESTYEDFEAYLGTPYYRYVDYTEEDYAYESYEWAYYGDEIHYVSITVWNGVISEINIEKRIEVE